MREYRSEYRREAGSAPTDHARDAEPLREHHVHGTVAATRLVTPQHGREVFRQRLPQRGLHRYGITP